MSNYQDDNYGTSNVVPLSVFRSMECKLEMITAERDSLAEQVTHYKIMYETCVKCKCALIPEKIVRHCFNCFPTEDDES
jgi:hypothetical protein